MFSEQVGRRGDGGWGEVEDVGAQGPTLSSPIRPSSQIGAFQIRGEDHVTESGGGGSGHLLCPDAGPRLHNQGSLQKELFPGLETGITVIECRW